MTHIEIDKEGRRVKSFAKDEMLVASYPASIGSEEKPAPTGKFKTKGVRFHHWYTYNPKYRLRALRRATSSRYSRAEQSGRSRLD